MAQHDYVIDNSTGANVRADINNVLQAIATNNSGSSDPSTTVASQFFADTNAGIMKLRNTSNNGYVNLFTLAGGVDVDAASTFSEDVTFTGAAANIVFDKSDNAFEFGDDAKAVFGTGNDLEIYHDGTNSIIKQVNGGLHIDGNSVNSIKIRPNASELSAQFVPNGAVNLYYDNSKKFETTSSGVAITGGITTSGASTINEDFTFTAANGEDLRFDKSDSAFEFNDNFKCVFGNSSDLQIYHDGSGSFIVDSGTGDLHIRASDDLKFETADGSETYILCNQNSSVDLYHDNSKKFETTSVGASITGQLAIDNTGGTAGKGELAFGASGRPFIEAFDSGNHGSGATMNFRTGAGDYMAVMKFDNAVELYYDNSKKFETTAAGTAVNQTTAGIGLDLTNTHNAFSAINLSIKNAHSAASSGKQIQFRDSGGNEVGSVMVNNTSTTYNTSSDYRLKENEEPISDGITRLKTLKPYRFNFKVNPDKIVDGFFAHEVTAIPEAVEGEKDGTEMQSLDYSRFTPLLTAALQEAIAKIETLEAKVASLEAA